MKTVMIRIFGLLAVLVVMGFAACKSDSDDDASALLVL